MKTDSIFYQLFQTFPSLLFELIDRPPSLANSYRFTSQEIKELSRTVDGLFLPAENAAEQPIYFVEVQFQQKKIFIGGFLLKYLFIWLNTNLLTIGVL